MEYEQIIPTIQSLTETQVDQIIPHRRPFRFIDSVLEVEFGKRAVAMLSDLTRPEYDWLKSHFPSYHLVPGAIIIEALAEVGAVAALGLPENRSKIGVLAKVNEMSFKRKIKPSDSVRLETEITRLRAKTGVAYGKATVDGIVMVEGSIMFGLEDPIGI